jgi:NAD(P)-dependent dehydrogenase (short-subunit alcohol dehydrogenase family)
MPDLSEQVVVITGASGNLGRAVSARLERAGAARVLLDRFQSGVRADDKSGRVLAIGGLDLTDRNAVSAALDQAVAQFGRIDGLVATAGAFEGGQPVHEQDWDIWERMLAANLRTALAACQAVIPHLLERGGRIVTIGGRPGFAGVGGLAAYSAAKSAVMRLTESLAQELRDKGITANCLVPSTIDTPQNRAAMPNADFSRWVPPEDIAEAVLFLLSEAGRSISGASIPVYGRA